MQLYEKVLAGLRSFAVAKVVTQIISWAAMVYTVRHLDSGSFGTFGLASVILSYGAMVFEGGVMEALIQHPPASRAERRSIFTLLSLLTLGLVTGVLLLADGFGRWFGDAQVGSVLTLLASLLVLSSLNMLPLADLLRQMRFHTIAVIAAIQALVAAITTVWLAYTGYGVWALVWGTLAGSCVRTLLLQLTCRGLEWPTWNVRPAFRYVRFAATLVLDNLLLRWYTTVDTLFLGRLSGTATLGYYTLAQDVANMPLEKVSSVVNDVSLPAYASLSGDRKQAAHLMLETIRMHATVGFPLFWGLAAVATPAVLVLFGEKWEFAIVPLMALAFVGPLRLMGSVETPLLTGLGRPDVLLKTKFVLVPCMTIGIGVGASWAGLHGVALAWVIVFPICYGFCFRWVLSLVGVSFGQFVHTVRGPCLAALLMAGAVLGLDTALSDAAAMLVRLLLGIALGGLLYPSLLWLLDRHAFVLLRDRVLRIAGISRASRVSLG